MLQDAVLEICNVRKLNKTEPSQIIIHGTPFPNWKRVWITALYFWPFHVRAHPNKNIKNGLEVMANVMAEFLAIAQHDLKSHE